MAWIKELGPSIGTYLGKPIPSYIIGIDGYRFEYDRIALTDEDDTCPLCQLQENECVIAPGLIYRAVGGSNGRN